MDRAPPLLSVESHVFRGMQMRRHILLIKTVMRGLSVLCVGGARCGGGSDVFQLGGLKWLHEEGSLLARPSREAEF